MSRYHFSTSRSVLAPSGPVQGDVHPRELLVDDRAPVRAEPVAPLAEHIPGDVERGLGDRQRFGPDEGPAAVERPRSATNPVG